MTKKGWLVAGAAGAAGAAVIALVVFHENVFDLASYDKQLVSYGCVDLDTCAGEVKKAIMKLPDGMKRDCRGAQAVVLFKLGQNYQNAQENQGRCRVTGAWESHPGDEDKPLRVVIWTRW